MTPAVGGGTRPEPLHVRVAAALRDEIADRRLPAGAALPSEAALQERFGVARSVVRQAMSTLVAEGLVQRGRGRGSIVTPAREFHRLVARSTGLSGQLSAQGSTVTTRVLRCEPVATPRSVTELGTQQVLLLERLRSVDAEPLAYIRTWLPLPLCSGLVDVDLTDASLHDVVRDRLGLSPASGPRQVRAVAADGDLARLLQARPGEPLLLLEGLTVTHDGLPFEQFATWHRADRVVFDVDPGLEQPGGVPPSGARSDQRTLLEAATAARELAARLEGLVSAARSGAGAG